MSSNSVPQANSQSIKSHLITQPIAIVCFVVVPAFITLMAPLTRLEFRREGSEVSATIVRYVLIYMPWKTEQLANVKGFRAEITAEKRYRDTVEERRKGNKGVRLATGQIGITTDAGETIVQASPELAKKIEEAFKAFVASESAGPLSYSVYASWWLSYVLGGIATGFCALYVFGAAITLARLPFKKAR